MVYTSIQSELRRLQAKHPDMMSLNMMRHLFHGTRTVDPTNIYSFESGLDMRMSNDGANGIGIYFADNSCYSHNYRFTNPQG